MKICQLGIYAEENKKNQLDIHVNKKKGLTWDPFN